MYNEFGYVCKDRVLWGEWEIHAICIACRLMFFAF